MPDATYLETAGMLTLARIYGWIFWVGSVIEKTVKEKAYASLWGTSHQST